MKQRFIILTTILLLWSCSREKAPETAQNEQKKKSLKAFTPPDTSTLAPGLWGDMVKYGKRLMRNTSYYIGPEGVVSHNVITHMSCNNCHLNDGTKAFGLSFFNSHKAYPQYRGREDMILTLADRVNNCITRPLGGQPLPLDSKEMVAMVSYIKWLGENYDPEVHEGYGFKDIDIKGLGGRPERGEKVYLSHCKRCHGEDGAGVLDAKKSMYVYPPLWGDKSYQEASSMHRVLKAAKFIKYNMPNDSSQYYPVLSDQEALDVAAFINDGRIHPRPKAVHVSFPNINTKSIDFFHGPYLDGFPDSVHAFGPWDDIIAFYTMKGLKPHY
ncbi:MAG TPA: c-type cytochrome [Bacteroidia bacterium]|nr:c-type cytochrome [Bacteroidia bacterium]